MTITASVGDTMLADFDIASDNPLRLGIALDDGLWLDSPGEIVRVAACDLRSLARKAAAVRADHPEAAVLADIDVQIASDAPSARNVMAASARAHDGAGLLYVGTPVGLVGLIMDVHALGIADGAVLTPAIRGTEGAVLQLIRDEVLPRLFSVGSPDIGTPQSRSA